MIPRFLVYTKPDCPFCVKAKSLLEENEIPFESIALETDEQRRDFLDRLQGWRTFPAIFELDSIGNLIRFVGGFDALSKFLFDRAGV